MFEIAGVDEETAKEALRLAINKLPIKCKIVSKETEGQNKMKAAEIRELSADDLQAKLKEAGKRGAFQPALPDGYEPA